MYAQYGSWVVRNVQVFCCIVLSDMYAQCSQNCQASQNGEILRFCTLGSLAALVMAILYAKCSQNYLAAQNVEISGFYALGLLAALEVEAALGGPWGRLAVQGAVLLGAGPD